VGSWDHLESVSLESFELLGVQRFDLRNDEVWLLALYDCSQSLRVLHVNYIVSLRYLLRWRILVRIDCNALDAESYRFYDYLLAELAVSEQH
jgi:hypothetical protein